MSNIEKVKFGDQVFDLIAAGVNLGESGGMISFQKGAVSFDSIEAILKASGSITQIRVSGETDWSRADLLYAGRLTKLSDQVIGTEQVKVGTNKETREPIYENKDIKGEVMIAYFKAPDLTERVAVLETENEALKATDDKLVLAGLEA